MQQQAAVLDGVGDGVVATTPDGVVRCATARRRADAGRVTDPVGARVRVLGLPRRGSPPPSTPRRAADRPRPSRRRADPLRRYVTQCRRRSRDLGVIAVLRDRTDLMACRNGWSRRRDDERAAGAAPRVREPRARRRRAHRRRPGRRSARLPRRAARASRPIAAPGGRLERIDEPLLQAVRRAPRPSRPPSEACRCRSPRARSCAACSARQRTSVRCSATSSTTPSRRPSPRSEQRGVEVELLDDGDVLAVTVADSGDGVADPTRPFAGGDVARRRARSRTPCTATASGSPRARYRARRGGERLARRSGRRQSGAVFCARLPGVMRAASGSRHEGGRTHERQHQGARGRRRLPGRRAAPRHRRGPTGVRRAGTGARACAPPARRCGTSPPTS